MLVEINTIGLIMELSGNKNTVIQITTCVGYVGRKHCCNIDGIC